MNIIDISELKPDTIESLARLWTNKDFQVLVVTLRTSRELFAQKFLTRRTDSNNWLEIRELQDIAEGFSRVILTVEKCFEKLNREKE